MTYEEILKQAEAVAGKHTIPISEALLVMLLKSFPPPKPEKCPHCGKDLDE